MSSVAEFVVQCLHRIKTVILELLGQRPEQEADMRYEEREQTQDVNMDLNSISSSDDEDQEVEYYTYNQEYNMHTTREIEIIGKKSVCGPVGYHYI